MSNLFKDIDPFEGSGAVLDTIYEGLMEYYQVQDDDAPAEFEVLEMMKDIIDAWYKWDRGESE